MVTFSTAYSTWYQWIEGLFFYKVYLCETKCVLCPWDFCLYFITYKSIEIVSTLMTGTRGWNLADSWLRTSANSCWCFNCFLIFIILTIAAYNSTYTSSLYRFIYNSLVENNQHSLKDRELLLKLPSRPIQVCIHSLHHPDFQAWTICSSMDIVQCSKWKQMWLDSPRKLLIGMLTTFPQCNCQLDFPGTLSQTVALTEFVWKFQNNPLQKALSRCIVSTHLHPQLVDFFSHLMPAYPNSKYRP